MGRYVRGDVILASVPFEERHGTKTRPALVVSVPGERGSYSLPD